eukprot:2465249-Rhodomonas_salina.1
MRAPSTRPARPHDLCGRPIWSVTHTSARGALLHRKAPCTSIGSAPPLARVPSTAAAGGPG